MNKQAILLIFTLFFAITLTAIAPVGLTIKVEGEVSITRNDVIYDADKGDRLFNDDLIKTGESAFTAIKFSDNKSLVKLFPNSSLHIEAEKKGDKVDKKVKLSLGDLWAKVSKKQGKFEVENATTVASVKGTEFLITQNSDGSTEVFTFEGAVQFTNKSDGLSSTISAGQRGLTMGSGDIAVTEFSIDEIPTSIREAIEEELNLGAPVEEIDDDLTPEIDEEMRNIEESSAPAKPKKSSSSSTTTPRASGEREGFSFGGSAGTAVVNQQTYTRVRLMPELVLGKFGIGLDIDLMIDNEGEIRKEDWDDPEDYLNKFLYVRYGQRGDTFYGKIGAFTNYTLGHGLIMRNYTNMLLYPDIRQIGLQLGGKLPVANIGIEGFSSNILENDILAGRITTQPFLGADIPVLNKIMFGGSIAHDQNQFKGLIDTDDDNYPDIFDDYPYDDDWHNQVDHDIDDYRAIYFELYPNGTEESFENWFNNSETLNSLRNPSFDDIGEDDVTIFGADYELPLMETDLFYLSHYGEYAQILDHGAGFIFPGFFSKFLIFQMNLEFRMYQEDFIGSFFDNIYDQERAVAYEVNDDYVIMTKEDLVPLAEETRGWYGSLETNIFNFLFVTVAYEDMYGDDDIHSRSLWGQARLEQRFIPNLSRAEINYSQTRFENLKKLKSPSASIEGILGYNLGPTTQLVGSYKERYLDLDGNGKIKGSDETVKTMAFGVEFRF